LGLQRTVAFAMSLNVVSGLLVLWAAGCAAPAASTGSEPAEARPVSSNAARPVVASRLVSLYAAFAIVGATTMACEIGWTRVLATVIGSSTYAFTLMLASALAGMSLGSWWFSRHASRPERLTLRAWSWTQTGLALTGAVLLVSYRGLPPLAAMFVHASAGRFAEWTAAQATIAAIAIVPTATLLGFNFPLMLLLIERARGRPAWRGDSPEEGAHVGSASAINTSGAVLGAFLAGFVVLPAVGAYELIALSACIHAIIGAAGSIDSGARRGIRRAVVHAALVVALIWVGGSPRFFPPRTAAFAAALYGDLPGSHLGFQEIVDTEDVLFLEEGLTATVAVTRTDDYFALKINGKVDASTLDQSTQLLLGDLGAILHPHPRRALIVGFGSGMTVSAVARFPDLRLIDCVEIEPAVLHAAPALQRLNRGVLSDPRVHVVIDDARSFVQTGGPLYDLIVSEPSNPWIAGVAALFTDEFYAAVRRRLAPGGMFVQWVQAYALAPDDLRMIIATIASRFEDVSLWHSQRRDFLVLARTEEGPLDLDRARSLWRSPSLQEDFGALHLVSPESWLAYLRLGDRELRALTAGAPKNTDDLARLEYRAPRALFDDTLVDALDALVRDGQRDVLGSMVSESDRRAALIASAASQLEMKSPWAQRTMDLLAEEPALPALEVLRGRMELARERISDARVHFQNAERAGADRFEVEYWSALAERAGGDDHRAMVLLRQVLEHDPTNVQALRARLEFARASGDWDDAVDAARALQSQGRTPSAADDCELGDIELRAGRRREAEKALRDGLVLDPYSFLCHRDLGELERAAGRAIDACADLEFVVRYFPESDPKTYLSLALLHRSEGRPSEARAVLDKGRRLFPDDPALRRAEATMP
jgi:predicted membrane-bound spermidine synthase/tetratricopeptide (TPR) repeat protein